MELTTPKTPDEYLDLVDQAIFEIEDLLSSAAHEGMDDGWEISEFIPLYEYLRKELGELHKGLTSGHHQFGTGERLPFANDVAKWQAKLPCADILRVIVNSYRDGFK